MGRDGERTEERLTLEVNSFELQWLLIELIDGVTLGKLLHCSFS